MAKSRRGAVGVLVLLGVSAAWLAPLRAGTIAGTVRGPGGVPLSGLMVSIYDNDTRSNFTFTNDQGAYLVDTGPQAALFSVWALPVSGSPLVGELYYEIPCPGGACSPMGTEVWAPAVGTTSGIDFDLVTGGTIQGAVTSTLDGAPLEVNVAAYDQNGRSVSSAQSSPSTGAYVVRGLAPGSYFVRTNSFGDHADELHPNQPCMESCDVFQGIPILVGAGGTTTGVDFALGPAGAIAGTISDGSGPLANAAVEVYRLGRIVGRDFTGSNGAYQIAGLHSGVYHVLARKSGRVTEVYPNAPCPGTGCDTSSSGSGVVVTASLLTTGIDIQLAPGFSISGTLKMGGFNGFVGNVQVFDAVSGRMAGSAESDDAYTVTDLPGGTNYKVRVFMSGALAELYDNVPCPGSCSLEPGATVGIGSANVTGVNFDLAPARMITGTVRDQANGDLLKGIGVQAVGPGGVVYDGGETNLFGTYFFTREGLPAGIYRVRTVGAQRMAPYLDEVWNNIPCEFGCGSSAGDPIAVGSVDDTRGINFELIRSGLDFFTLTPCRVFDSRLAGPPILSGQMVPLRIETKCGVPGHAAAVSANVTVVSPSGPGSVSIWPVNLPAPPGTSVVSFRTGTTRANNAMLALSLAGLHNVWLSGMVTGSGSYHVLVDVNGYFAPSVSP